MEPETVLRIGREALLLVLLISGPAIAAALVVGLLVSVVQAATQIQEQTLTFVPKVCAVVLVLAVAGLWMVNLLTRFASGLLGAIPELVG